MAVLDDDGDYKRLANGGEARYLLPVGAILSVGDGDEAKPGDVLARLPDRKRQDARHHRRSAAGGRAVRGPPAEGLRGDRRDGRPGRVRARLQEQAPDQDHPGDEGDGEAVEFLIPKGKHIAVHDGDMIRKGEYLIDGNPDPHDILRIQGIEALADFLVNEIQEVYRLQGVPINDKHIETIVRQMLQKVEILEPGDTGLLKGDHLDKLEVEEENAKAEARGGRPALDPAGAARHHQGVAADPQLHLGGVVPGDHPRPHRRGGARQASTPWRG